jgi:hypothetical protein
MTPPTRSMSLIVVLAFFLASGILSVILSCALDNNYLTLISVLTYLLAAIPNQVCQRLHARDMFQESKILELGYFFTSIFIVSGFGLPMVLNHSNLITNHAMYLSLSGGFLIYLTICGYISAFGSRQDIYI